VSFAAGLLRGLVLAYRWTLSPLLGPRCRFLPTCSAYALDALASHGAVAGGWLVLRRLARCHPWGGSGYDPVPPVRVSRPDLAACCHTFAPTRVHTAQTVTVPGTREEP
jgi:putative membrane protein insertion efficiency factor